jgi:hypothetical protein
MVDETIRWRSVSEEQPDADTLVLLYCPDEDEPIFPGALDGDRWISDGYEVEPTHWAHMPAGPQSSGGGSE